MTDQPTPTPRTDDAQFGTGRVSVAFAQRLERELSAERALADRLAGWMEDHRKNWQWHKVDPSCDCEDCVFLIAFDEALAAWKEARRE